jgi:hypothetical protein
MVDSSVNFTRALMALMVSKYDLMLTINREFRVIDWLRSEKKEYVMVMYSYM